ncbi:MAG: UDP-N-acetylglucosamine--N-acetylmuramyl-(pentapeptide) pyrophosphoryl-undecaprenol N-acetylglucosamine transferase [Armatimonadetes bacterium]|nr:UDP-N-acetylglucosamine--N-acetylmuramyl-(pentapeptide) pyrophosphoryl-undecaprenol N-acetylglucosamine transferase [Armatimonadota bacterium]
MRLAVSGGGTGGHVYPALEIARHAISLGDEVFYLGSHRGQEGAACQAAGIPFQAYPAEPLWSLKTPQGWKAAMKLLQSVGMAKTYLRSAKPQALLSTGGYSSAPALAAARRLGIPFVIYEANSAPGRTHRMFARDARAFCTLFKSTSTRLPNVRTIRTGAPIRKALREAAKDLHPDGLVLVVGGSQGSAFLNERVPELRDHVEGGRFLHAFGKKNFTAEIAEQSNAEYERVAYLESEAITKAYQSASVVIARSGGTLAELALFRTPSVLVPLPTSADGHQRHNAEEFFSMGAATLIDQSSWSAEAAAAAVNRWLQDGDARGMAQSALAEWDIPDATERVYEQLATKSAPRLS